MFQWCHYIPYCVSGLILNGLQVCVWYDGQPSAECKHTRPFQLFTFSRIKSSSNHRSSKRIGTLDVFALDVFYLNFSYVPQKPTFLFLCKDVKSEVKSPCVYWQESLNLFYPISVFAVVSFILILINLLWLCMKNEK